MLISIVLIAIFAIGAVSAADENITDTTTEILSAEPTEVIEASPGDFGELSTLTRDTPSGGTLYLEKNYLNSKSNSIEISKEITIDGQGHTINANAKSNIFNVKNDKVVLKNINFINSKSVQSAVYGNCTIVNCSFVNCVAFSSQYPTYYFDSNLIPHFNYTGLSGSYGGAIHNGTAYNCSFTDCYSTNNARYEPSLDEYIFSFGGCGGAIYGGDAHCCTFTNCYAKHYEENEMDPNRLSVVYGLGSAIYNGNAYDCTFIDFPSEGYIVLGGNNINPLVIKIPIRITCPNSTVNYGEGGILPIRAIDADGTNIDGWAVDVKVYKDNKLINSFSSATGCDLNVDAAPGNYIIELDSTYADPLNVSLTVNKGSPKIALANNFAKSGQTANVKVSISKKAAGNVKITINGETYRVPINSGFASVDVPNLADGNYTVKATYAGNFYHTGETMTDTFHVGKFTQGMKLVAGNIHVGETERLEANLAKDTTGFVRFIIGADTYKVKIENGVAYADIDNLKAGTYSVTLKYAGNYKYNGETVTKTFTVTKSSPGIKITAPDIKAGETAVIKVNLASDAPGNVWITVNGETSKAKISTGMATISLAGLKDGTYDVSAKYAGNYKYNDETVTKTFTVTKSSPGLTLKANNIDYGVKDIVAELASDATGNVTVIVDGQSYNVKIDSGVATLRLSGLKDGTYEVKVKYAGDDKYNAQTRSRTMTVKKFPPELSVSAKTTDAKTTITARINKDAAGDLKITFEGTTYTSQITNGATTITLNDLIPGSYTVTVGYDGDSRYDAGTITRTFSVDKSSPGITITANNINVDEVATIKVNLANDVPGNVWITVNGESHKVAISDGVATLTLSGLKAGTYGVSVKYNGNYKYLAETKTARFIVSKSSPGLTVFKTTVDGKTVLTANIAADASENVNFLVNGNTYTAKITNGVATVTLPDMAPGTYTLKSTYNGNYKYLSETKTRSITIK